MSDTTDTHPVARVAAGVMRLVQIVLAAAGGILALGALAGGMNAIAALFVLVVVLVILGFVIVTEFAVRGVRRWSV